MTDKPKNAAESKRMETLKNKVKSKGFLWWFKLMCYLGVAGFVSGVILVAGIIFYFAQQVPDFRTLADYRPSLVTKVYAKDGTLLAEYAKERRIYIPIEEIPQRVIEAYLAAEDSAFYQHQGFDPKGILRAALVNTFTNRKQGASTITQQLVKTSLLSSERTYTRKIKEVILSWRIEKFLSKNEILELYLNQIYLGNGAYGVGAASIAYFDKPLNELSIGQYAMLAGLPKAPSAYNPVRKPRVARLRRDVVIKRMEAERFITPQEAQMAIESGLGVQPRGLASGEDAPHFSEHIRRFLEEKYGEERLYRGGLVSHTTLDPQLQKFAESAIYKGLREYDRRHGFRGPIGHMGLLINWQKRMKDEKKKWKKRRKLGEPAVVLELDDVSKTVEIGLAGGHKGFIPFKALTWARKYIEVDKLGPKIRKPSDVLEVGNIVFVKLLSEIPNSKTVAENMYSLEQVPQVQGALVAMDSESGAVRALVGGLGDGSGFNRATQAYRQAGSAFKPFVYTLALERGYTPASIVLDAPVVLRNEEAGAWKPHNYSQKVYGPSTMRLGLEKSRNLMTIRLARDLRMGNILQFSNRIGLEGKMERDLSAALGSGSFTLLDLTAGYALFPNGGKKVEPYFIDRIQDAVGNTIFTPMPDCVVCSGSWTPESQDPPVVAIETEQVIDSKVAYQTASMLRGVVQRGTGWRAKEVGHPVGGKTGTTDDYKDAWFMGFSSNMAVGVWVGFDTPRKMGKVETGSKAANPIWTYFMTDALKDKPKQNIKVPDGITFVRIDAKTGELPTVNSKNTILEAFVEGTEPTARGSVNTNKRKIRGETSSKQPKVQFQGIY